MRKLNAMLAPLIFFDFFACAVLVRTVRPSLLKCNGVLWGDLRS